MSLQCPYNALTMPLQCPYNVLTMSWSRGRAAAAKRGLLHRRGCHGAQATTIPIETDREVTGPGVMGCHGIEMGTTMCKCKRKWGGAANLGGGYGGGYGASASENGVALGVRRYGGME